MNRSRLSCGFSVREVTFDPSGQAQQVVGSGRQQSAPQWQQEEGGAPPPPHPGPLLLLVHLLPPAAPLRPPTSSLLPLLKGLQLLLVEQRENGRMKPLGQNRVTGPEPG